MSTRVHGNATAPPRRDTAARWAAYEAYLALHMDTFWPPVNGARAAAAVRALGVAIRRATDADRPSLGGPR